MKVIIEIESDDDLRRVQEVLGPERIEVRSHDPAATRRVRRERLRDLQREVRIALPEGFRFNRETIYLNRNRT